MQRDRADGESSGYCLDFLREQLEDQLKEPQCNRQPVM